jgi:hypothetical protein
MTYLENLNIKTFVFCVVFFSSLEHTYAQYLAKITNLNNLKEYILFCNLLCRELKISFFVKEKWPVYTAAKMDGKVIFGDVDLSVSKVPPQIRYSEFFKIG